MPQGDVASPCVKRCELDEARGICLGCGRSLAEIAAWPTASPALRAVIVAAARQRLQEVD